MDKIINATKVFERRVQRLDNTRTFYCIECNNIHEYVEHSQLIQIYDLDNDGVLRVGFPSNPFIANRYFSSDNECKFLDKEEMERLTSLGKKPVQTAYYYAFDSIETIKRLGIDDDIIKIVVNTNNQLVDTYTKLSNSIERIAVLRKAYK